MNRFQRVMFFAALLPLLSLVSSAGFADPRQRVQASPRPATGPVQFSFQLPAEINAGSTAAIAVQFTSDRDQLVNLELIPGAGYRWLSASDIFLQLSAGVSAVQTLQVLIDGDKKRYLKLQLTGDDDNSQSFVIPVKPADAAAVAQPAAPPRRVLPVD